jgi:long-chain acyl-CoA synthetase
VDRKKDMVVTGGYNVYSKEVEQALARHPGIADAAVVGVPDELYGEALAAFVQLRPGVRLEKRAIVDHCRAHLAGYKKPRHVVFVESLPRNSLGKVLKAELRKRGVS